MGLVIQEPQGSIAQLWPAKGASPGAAFTRTSSSSLCVRRGIPGPARPSIQTEAAVNGVSEARGPRQRGPTIAAGQGHPGTPEPHRITDLLQGFRMLQACGASVIEGAYRYLQSATKGPNPTVVGQAAEARHAGTEAHVASIPRKMREQPGYFLKDPFPAGRILRASRRREEKLRYAKQPAKSACGLCMQHPFRHVTASHCRPDALTATLSPKHC